MLKAEGSRAYLCVGRVSNPPFFRPTIIYFPIADFWASRVVAPRRTIPPLTARHAPQSVCKLLFFAREVESLDLVLATHVHSPGLREVIGIVDLQRHLAHVRIVVAGQIGGANESERKFRAVRSDCRSFHVRLIADRAVVRQRQTIAIGRVESYHLAVLITLERFFESSIV
jgi:hypothetical protein